MRAVLASFSQMRRWKVVLVAVAAVAALGGLAFGAYTAWNEAEAETQQIRWANITVAIPGDSDILYARLSSAPQALARGVTGPVLWLDTGGDRSLVIIDAESGEVIYDDVLAAERAAFDAILATVELVEAEVTPGPAAPWPYGSTLPSTPRERWGPITYVAPDPTAGISVQGMMVDFIGPPPPANGPYIRVFNGRSQIHVGWTGDVALGSGTRLSLGEFTEAEPGLLEGIDPNDRAAFQRFVQAVEISPVPAPNPAPRQQAPLGLSPSSSSCSWR